MKFRVSLNGQTFEVEVGDLRARPIVALVDGEPVEVWPETEGVPTPQPAPVARPAAPAALPEARPTALHTRVIRAPIPGVIVSVAVRPGESVTAGQELCVLEAMKMKNPIRATHPGKIAEVNISAGQTVKHQELLMTYADE